MRDAEDVLLGAAIVLEDVTHLRELDRLKTEFIGVASHELRTPVQSLLLSVQLLSEGAAGELTPEQREIVAAQKDDLERMERMMRDLLDVTRLEAGVVPPRFELVEARELIDAAVRSALPQAEEKGIHLQSTVTEDLPQVRADRGQITRVLVNLLNNAVRHSPNGGEVTVTARLIDSRLRVAVIDHGSGIPQEYVPRIFERFVQVPGATRGGAGLGLSIAASIVHAHGGEIRVESEPGKGSEFTFELPAVQTQAKAAYSRSRE
jgi:NtrC-family two-component system sensor histidine kinase KinB